MSHYTYAKECVGQIPGVLKAAWPM